MKKITVYLLSIILLGALILSLCSCKKNPASTEDKPNNSSHTSSFQISGETEFTTSDNIHTYIISQNQGSLQSEKTLTILNKTSGELVQTVQLAENEWFTKKPIYLVDVSFDGHVDIIVPHARPASAAYFQAYIWDVEHNKYQYASHYESIPNIAIDFNNKLLLSYRTADKITSYSMHSYSAEKCDIIEIRSIYWEPQENLNSILFQEFAYSNDGTSELLQQFNASAIDSITIDKTDSQVAPYFSNNSIWNLNGEKWNNLVIPISEYNYADGNDAPTLKEAFENATKQFQQQPERHRNLGELQSETQEILLLNDKFYQSYISDASGLRYIFIHKSEYPMSANWDWVPIGTANTYSLELLGEIDEGYK